MKTNATKMLAVLAVFAMVFSAFAVLSTEGYDAANAEEYVVDGQKIVLYEGQDVKSSADKNKAYFFAEDTTITAKYKTPEATVGTETLVVPMVFFVLEGVTVDVKTPEELQPTGAASESAAVFIEFISVKDWDDKTGELTLSKGVNPSYKNTDADKASGYFGYAKAISSGMKEEEKYSDDGEYSIAFGIGLDDSLSLKNDNGKFNTTAAKRISLVADTFINYNTDVNFYASYDGVTATFDKFTGTVYLNGFDTDGVKALYLENFSGKIGVIKGVSGTPATVDRLMYYAAESDRGTITVLTTDATQFEIDGFIPENVTVYGAITPVDANERFTNYGTWIDGTEDTSGTDPVTYTTAWPLNDDNESKMIFVNIGIYEAQGDAWIPELENHGNVKGGKIAIGYDLASGSFRHGPDSSNEGTISATDLYFFSGTNLENGKIAVSGSMNVKANFDPDADTGNFVLKNGTAFCEGDVPDNDGILENNGLVNVTKEAPVIMTDEDGVYDKFVGVFGDGRIQLIDGVIEDMTHGLVVHSTTKWQATERITANDDMTISEGKTLVVQGELIIPAGYDLDINGTLIIDGQFAKLINYGNIDVGQKGRLIINGALFINEGNVVIESESKDYSEAMMEAMKVTLKDFTDEATAANILYGLAIISHYPIETEQNTAIPTPDDDTYNANVVNNGSIVTESEAAVALEGYFVNNGYFKMGGKVLPYKDTPPVRDPPATENYTVTGANYIALMNAGTLDIDEAVLYLDRGTPTGTGSAVESANQLIVNMISEDATATVNELSVFDAANFIGYYGIIFTDVRWELDVDVADKITIPTDDVDAPDIYTHEAPSKIGVMFSFMESWHFTGTFSGLEVGAKLYDCVYVNDKMNDTDDGKGVFGEDIIEHAEDSETTKLKMLTMGGTLTTDGGTVDTTNKLTDTIVVRMSGDIEVPEDLTILEKVNVQMSDVEKITTNATTSNRGLLLVTGTINVDADEDKKGQFKAIAGFADSTAINYHVYVLGQIIINGTQTPVKTASGSDEGAGLTDKGTTVTGFLDRAIDGAVVEIKGTSKQTVITTFEQAVDIAAENSVKKIDLYGYNEVTDDVTVPAGITVSQYAGDAETAANPVFDTVLYIDEGVMVYFEEDAKYTNAEKTVVEGSLYFENAKNFKKSETSKLEGDVVSKGVKDLYYTNIYLAIFESEMGDEITLNNNVELKGDITIPAGVTVKTENNKLDLIGCTLTIDGLMYVNGGDLVMSENDANGDEAEIVLNGDLWWDDRLPKVMDKVPGAYYMYDDNNQQIGKGTSVKNSQYVIDDADKGEITIIGDINEPELTFAGEDNFGKIYLKDATKVSAGKITLHDAMMTFPEGAKIQATIANENGSADIFGATVKESYAIAEVWVGAEDNLLYLAGEFVQDDSKSGKFNLNDVVILGYTDGSNFKHDTIPFKVDAMQTYGNIYTDGAVDIGTLEVMEGSFMADEDTVVNANVIAVFGELYTEAKTTNKAKDGKIIVKNALFVGMPEGEFELFQNLGADNTGSVMGNVEFGIAYVSPFATLDVDKEYDHSTVYIDKTVWAVVYANDYKIDALLRPYVADAVFQHWEDADGDRIGATVEVGQTDFENIYAVFDYDLFTINILTEANVKDVFIDGKLMSRGGTDSSSYSKSFFLGGLTAGQHKITMNVDDGYNADKAKLAEYGGAVSGKANVSINGFTVTIHENEDDDTILPGYAAVLTITGIELDIPEPEPEPAQGLTVTEILLIIVVIIIAIMAVVLILRLNRS